MINSTVCYLSEDSQFNIAYSQQYNLLSTEDIHFNLAYN